METTYLLIFASTLILIYWKFHYNSAIKTAKEIVMEQCLSKKFKYEKVIKGQTKVEFHINRKNIISTYYIFYFYFLNKNNNKCTGYIIMKGNELYEIKWPRLSK